MEHLGPDVVADRVVDGIAEDRGDDQHDHEHMDVEIGYGDDGARDEEDRVAGQERADDETRFREDHDKQDRIDPGAVLRGECCDRLVERKQRVEGSASLVSTQPAQSADCLRTTSVSVPVSANACRSHAAWLP